MNQKNFSDNNKSSAEKRERQEQISSQPKSRWGFRPWLYAVAVLILLAFWAVRQQQTSAEKKEAQLAFEQTKEALILLSTQLNKGTEKAAYLKVFDATTRRIVHLDELQ